MAGPVVHNGAFRAAHSAMAGDNLHPPFHYAQNTDPGAVGAGRWWFDTSVNFLKVRNAADDDWTVVGSPSSGGGAPTTAKFILQVPDGSLPNAQSLNGLTDGLVKTTAGVLSTAVAADLPAHTHVFADVSGVSALVHSHAQSDVTNLTTDLAGKAATVHSHAQADVTNLTTDLAAKVNDTGDNMTGTLNMYSGSDLRFYSDAGVTNTLNLFSSGQIRFGTSTGVYIGSGAGSPEGVVTAPIGSVYLRNDGGAGSVMYRKESGTGNTGWVADTASAGTPQQLNTGLFNVPGPGVINTTNVTALTTGQSLARYIGMAPQTISTVVVELRVTTAAATITWAEVGLASAPTMTSGSLTTITSQSVSTTFNSTGSKTVTFSGLSITSGTFLYFLAGAQATTPFQLRATMSDENALGVIRLATARPSTMAAATAFSSNTTVNPAAYIVVRWS